MSTACLLLSNNHFLLGTPIPPPTLWIHLSESLSLSLRVMVSILLRIYPSLVPKSGLPSVPTLTSSPSHSPFKFAFLCHFFSFIFKCLISIVGGVFAMEVLCTKEALCDDALISCTQGTLPRNLCPQQRVGLRVKEVTMGSVCSLQKLWVTC